jgi:hypothetical protein
MRGLLVASLIIHLTALVWRLVDGGNDLPYEYSPPTSVIQTVPGTVASIVLVPTVRKRFVSV